MKYSEELREAHRNWTIDIARLEDKILLRNVIIFISTSFNIFLGILVYTIINKGF